MTIETMTKLVTYTVGAGGVASPITFSNIPQTYTDLKIEISVRGSGTSTPTLSLSSVNGVTGNMSTKTFEFYQGISSGYSSSATTTSLAPIVYTSTSHTANTFTSATIYISNYSSNLIKNFYTEYFMESMNNADYIWNGIMSGLWSNTNPINSLTFTTDRTLQQYTTVTIYGVTSQRRAIARKAVVTGGTLSSDNQYFYRTFTSTGVLSISGSDITADVLVVAGGGAGGASAASGYYGGGGGAGGLLDITRTKLNGTHSVIIGAGGPYPGAQQRGTQGTNSSLGTIVAIGGGGGGGGSDSLTLVTSEKNGGIGGSGGGGQSAVGYNSLGGGVGGAGISGQGNSGGNGAGAFGYEPQAGGGGGGAGAAGTNASSAAVGGAGGTGGAYTAWGQATGTGQLSSGIYYYAGGGGGASNGTGGAAGLGGGGAGGGANGANGTANTGGGAGNGMVGGSGIVIVRYAKTQVV
jgi:hypothetical protein